MAARYLRSGLPLLRTHLAASESATIVQGSRSFASQVAKPTGKQIKHTSTKPLGDRVLVKVNRSEAKAEGGILLQVFSQGQQEGKLSPLEREEV